MNGPGEDNKQAFRSAIWTTVIGVAVITIVVLFVALFAGLWLDRAFGSRPLFTIGLVIIGIPVSILLTLWLVKKTTRQLKDTQGHPSTKELNRGTDDYDNT